MLFAAGPLVAVAAFWVTVVRHDLDTRWFAILAQDTDAFAIAGTTPAVIGLVMLAARLTALGQWLRSEDPVERRDPVTT